MVFPEVISNMFGSGWCAEIVATMVVVVWLMDFRAVDVSAAGWQSQTAVSGVGKNSEVRGPPSRRHAIRPVPSVTTAPATATAPAAATCSASHAIAHFKSMSARIKVLHRMSVLDLPLTLLA